MQISRRLETVADLVTSGRTVADVGTDHAYIPIYLIQEKKAARVIAMDVNRGPLQRAKEHIAQYHLENQIETRLSDGLEALAQDEAQTVIIAGMGGPLTVRILTEGAEKLGACGELILQPQSEIGSVRAHLQKNGWRIVREEMIKEEGKYYPMMRAVRGFDAEGSAALQEGGLSVDQEGLLAGAEVPFSEAEKKYGRLLLARRHPVLREFLQQELATNRRILDSLKDKQGEGAVHRRSEVLEEIQMIEAALEKVG